MLAGYADRDHYGTDQAKEGQIMGSRFIRQERRIGVHGQFASAGPTFIRPVCYRGRDAHAMRSLLERR